MSIPLFVLTAVFAFLGLLMFGMFAFALALPITLFCLYIALIVAFCAGVWCVFTKAGRSGWIGFIPFYNVWTLFKMAGKPGWWMFLMFIPIVNVVIGIIGLHALVKSFGHGILFMIGLIVVPPIFITILGLGDSRYLGPQG